MLKVQWGGLVLKNLEWINIFCDLNVFIMCKLNDAALLLNLNGCSSRRASSSIQPVLY